MSPSTDGRAAKVLIVDDQGSNVRLLEQTLRRAGYTEVMSTTEPRDAEAMHLEHRYDLVVLDLQMPGMNGFEVMERLRQPGQAHRVAILVMSADPSQLLPVLEKGGDGFLEKPFRLADLVERVELILKKAAAAGGNAAAAYESRSPLPQEKPARS